MAPLSKLIQVRVLHHGKLTQDMQTLGDDGILPDFSLLLSFGLFAGRLFLGLLVRLGHVRHFQVGVTGATDQRAVLFEARRECQSTTEGEVAILSDRSAYL